MTIEWTKRTIRLKKILCFLLNEDYIKEKEKNVV